MENPGQTRESLSPGLTWIFHQFSSVGGPIHRDSHVMNQELKVLFHKVADLNRSQREDYYAQQHVPAAARAEVESLLVFDGTPGDSLSSVIGSAAEDFLRSTAPVSEDGRCGPYRLV